MIAIPIIVQGMVLQIQTLINRAFLGNIKTEYLSAIGNTIFPLNATMSIVSAISTGLTILVSRSYGAGDREKAREYTESSAKYSTGISFLLFIVWFFFSEIIFGFMGVDRQLIPYCAGYVKIIAVSVILFGIDTTLQGSLQGLGRTNPIMFIGLMKVVLNVFLDWVLIFGKFGLPALGMNGAGLSTAISNIVSISILSAYILKSNSLPFKIKIKGIMSASWLRYKEIANLGLPAGFEIFAFYVGTLVMLRFMNSLEAISAGIFTLTSGIEVFVFFIYNGFARAAITLIGQSTGRGEKKEARNILTSCLRIELIIVAVICAIFILFRHGVVGIFSTDPVVIQKAQFLFIITSLAMFPKSMNVVVGSAIRAIGDTRWMLKTQIFGTAFVILSSYMCIFVFKLGILGVYLTGMMDEGLRSIINTIRFYHSQRDTKVCAREKAGLDT